MKSSFATVVAAALLFALSGFAQAGDSVLIIIHEVRDFTAWKSFYDSDKPNRDKAGLVQRFLVRDADRPNVVTIVFEAPDAGAARAFTSNPALKEVMIKAGVMPPPNIAIGNVAK
jgi:hypothetical protein